MSRIFGIRHRIKARADQKASPTQVTVIDAKSGNIIKDFSLDTEQEEMDFLHGVHVLSYRKVTAEDDLELIKNITPAHLLKVKKSEVKGEDDEIVKIPKDYIGPEPGDKIAMILGGSGDYFARALAQKGVQDDFTVYRIPPKGLSQARGNDNRDKAKEGDATLLAELLFLEPEKFYEIESTDVKLIRVRMTYHALQDSMKDRIAAEQRLHAAAKGRYFTKNIENAANTLEQYYKELKASDPGYQALLKIEKEKGKELENAVEDLEFYRDVLKPIKGLGPRIAGRLIAAIQDVRRFPKVASFRKFCGVHVNLTDDDGKALPREKQFPRKRHGKNLDHTPEARQALFLLADQFNRRPDSRWGQKLREVKAKLQEKHPEPIKVTNAKGKIVTLYSPGHLHKIAIWKTLSKFASWLYKVWFAHEKAAGRKEDSRLAA